MSTGAAGRCRRAQLGSPLVSQALLACFPRERQASAVLRRAADAPAAVAAVATPASAPIFDLTVGQQRLASAVDGAHSSRSILAPVVVVVVAAAFAVAVGGCGGGGDAAAAAVATNSRSDWRCVQQPSCLRILTPTNSASCIFCSHVIAVIV